MEHWFSVNSQIQLDQLGHIIDVNYHPTRCDTFWVFTVIHRGTRSFRFRDEEYRLHAGDFFLLPPHVPHGALDLDDHDACFVHFFADGGPIEKPTHIEADRIVMPLTGHTPANYDCFSLMNYCYEQSLRPFMNRDLAKHQILALLIALSMHAQQRKIWAVSGNDTGDRILSYIRNHLDCQPDAADYESEFGLCYRQLNLIFSRQYHLTIKQCHQKMRIEYAAMLLNSGKSLSDTFKACGFSDYFYFIKCFKQQRGITPAQYQRRTSVRGPHEGG